MTSPPLPPIVERLQAKDQAMMERFAAKLGSKFKLMEIGDTSFFECVNPLKKSGCGPQTPEEKEEMLKFPYREAVGEFM